MSQVNSSYFDYSDGTKPNFVNNENDIIPVCKSYLFDRITVLIFTNF